jgi:hypothetical protein
LLEPAPRALADICAVYLAPLLDWLAAKYPHVDPDLRQTAVHDALISYGSNPNAYDPQRGDLAKFLRMAARADLYNLHQREARHHHERIAWSVVEDDPEGGNLSGREEEPTLRLQRDEEAEECRSFLHSVQASLDPADQRVLELMVRGERATAVYATELGISGLPAQEQERQVKRAKDRIKKRLERGGSKHG